MTTADQWLAARDEYLSQHPYYPGVRDEGRHAHA